MIRQFNTLISEELTIFNYMYQLFLSITTSGGKMVSTCLHVTLKNQSQLQEEYMYYLSIDFCDILFFSSLYCTCTCNFNLFGSFGLSILISNKFIFSKCVSFFQKNDVNLKHELDEDMAVTHDIFLFYVLFVLTCIYTKSQRFWFIFDFIYKNAFFLCFPLCLPACLSINAIAWKTLNLFHEKTHCKGVNLLSSC